MTHLHEGMILALRDGMLVDADVRAHVDGCATCAVSLENARTRAQAIQEALAGVVMPSDVGAAKEAVRRRVDDRREAADRPARAVGFGPRLVSSAGAPPRSPLRHLRRAAAVLLLFSGAAAAATLPGSPVRDWIASLTAPARAPASVSEPTTQAASPETGIAVNVPDGEIQVVVRGAAPGSAVEVAWVDAATAAVTAPDGSTFAYRDGYVEVQAAAGDLRVELPRWARMASVEVDGRIYVRRLGEDVEVPGPVEGAVDGERLRFVVPDA